MLLFRSKVYQLVDSNVMALGAMKITVPSRPVCEQLQLYFQQTIDSVKTFYRMRICDEIFYCKNYTRVKKRNSFTVLYEKECMFHFGMIIQFYMVDKVAVALVQTMTVLSTHPFCEDSIPTVQVKEQEAVWDVIDVHMIREKCICVEIDDDTLYVSRFPCKILCD